VTDGSARFVGDFLGPEYDRDLDSAERLLGSYVICSTPRSGSGLLSRGLAAVGVGVPLEYFNPIHRELLVGRWGCGAELPAYVRELHRRRAAGGWFGAKLHWEQFSRLRAEATQEEEDPLRHETPPSLLERLFPTPRFIRVVREDLDRQAISYWRALCSQLWSLAVGEEAGAQYEDTPYDREAIMRCREAIANGELCWERLIREHGGRSIVVTYEELASDFVNTIERTADFISPGLAVAPTAPRTRQLADRRSNEMLERLRAERLREEPPELQPQPAGARTLRA